MPKGYEEMKWLDEEGIDEYMDLNTQNVSHTVAVSSVDYFIVDEFLNLNDKEFSSENEEKIENVKDESDIFDSEEYFGFKIEHNIADFDSFLSIPQEEPGLEWLSQFVEDTFSQFSCLNPVGFAPHSVQSKLKTGLKSAKGGLLINKSGQRNRTRTSGRVWPSPSNPNPNPNRNRTQPKKQAKKAVGPGSTSSGSSSGSPRKCSHCGVQKTPQWRSGPNGPKTLCNACGVRFKSGRLYPEYRPACSPTFSSELHSNSHRKVLEMRNTKKEFMTD